ncbi:ABC transporter permease [Moritella sp. F3]|uniref:ABC transporter permease n=1 Tax=Moritella sp. F3 TaxID=2718882 RepID=UPI001A355287|nr:ABC transporter permease [Moritella sp. F3]GIC78262.1 multidrug ABC transporter permease [Moritella sp. F1]GIC82510.1 multidrug ABC transporter permease [Moritella sp. F3]
MMSSFIRQIKAVWQRENRLILASKWQFSLVTWLPIACMLLVYAIFSQGIPRDLAVAVVDQDHSQSSRSLVRFIDANPALAVASQLTNLAEGKALMQRGEVYAVVQIPHGFEKKIYLAMTPEVSTFYNAQYVLIGKLVSSNMAKTFATFTAQIDAVKTLATGGHLALIKGAVAPISTQVNPLYNVSTNYVPFLVMAAVPALWQIFVLVSVLLAFGSEYKNNSQGRWFQRAEGVVTSAVIGKLLPYTLLSIVHGLLFLSFFYGYLSMPMHGNWGYLLLILVMGVLAGQAVALFIFTLTMNLTQAISMGAAYSAPAFAFIGVTFPAESMPQLAQIWRTLLPITHYMQLQIGQVNYGQSFTVLLPQLLALGLFTLTFVIAVARIKRHRDNALLVAHSQNSVGHEDE